MADIDRIVEVTITKQTQVPALPSFNQILIAGEFLKTLPVTPFATDERVRLYSSLTEVGTDFGTTHFIYKMASKIFGQSPSVNQIYVGRKLTGGDGSETWATALTAMRLYNDAWYAVVVADRLLANQEAVAVWVEANQKLAGFASADPVMVTSGTSDLASYLKTNNLERSFAIYDANSVYRDKALMTFDIDFVSLNSIAFTINGVAMTPVTFNGTNAQTYTDIKTMLETAFPSATVTVNGTARTVQITQVGVSFTWSVVVTLGVSQAVGTATYTDDVSEPWIEAAWFGAMLPKDPGSANWAYKTLSLVTASVLTGSQINYLTGKHCNFYSNIASIDLTQFGTIGSGDYIDVTQGLDWLQAQIQNKVFTLLIQSDKVPYTDVGIQQIVAQLRSALQAGVDQGIIQKDYTVSYPAAADVSAVDKAARNLPDVTFTALLEGAINTVQIAGTVTL